MSQYSLQGSTNRRGGHVITGEQERLLSERIFNPQLTWCCPRGNNDLVGRNAETDTLISETAGCDMGAARIFPENNVVRPLVINSQQLTSTCGLRDPSGKCASKTVWVNGNYGYNGGDAQVYPREIVEEMSSPEYVAEKAKMNREKKYVMAKSQQK